LTRSDRGEGEARYFQEILTTFCCLKYSKVVQRVYVAKVNK